MIDPVLPLDVPSGHSFRSRIVVKLEFPPGAANPTVTSWGGDAGTCRLYDGKSLIPDALQQDPAGSLRVVDPRIVDDQPRSCRNESGLVEKKLGPATHDPLVLSRDPNDGGVIVRIKGAAPNPIIPFSLYNNIAIKWDFSVKIFPDLSTFSISGTHTCYPAHEVIVSRGSGGQYLWRYGPNQNLQASQSQPSPPNISDNDRGILSGCLVTGGGTVGYGQIPVVNQISIF